MAKFLQAILFVATIAAAAAESINIHGQVNDDLINNIYNGFGGSWDLSSSGVAGFENVSIGGLLINADMHAMFPNRSTITIGRHHKHNSSLSSRGVVSIGTPTCDNPSTPNSPYQLLTVAQQQWLASKFCNTVGYFIPHSLALAGLVFTNVPCPHQATCNVIITVAVTEIAVHLQPAWYDKCIEAYNAIPAGCGENGGSVQITLPDTTVTPNVQVTYQSELFGLLNGNPVTPALTALSCHGSNAQCTTYACSNGQCGPAATD